MNLQKLILSLLLLLLPTSAYSEPVSSETLEIVSSWAARHRVDALGSVVKLNTDQRIFLVETLKSEFLEIAKSNTAQAARFTIETERIDKKISETIGAESYSKYLNSQYPQFLILQEQTLDQAASAISTQLDLAKEKEVILRLALIAIQEESYMVMNLEKEKGGIPNHSLIMDITRKRVKPILSESEYKSFLEFQNMDAKGAFNKSS